MKPMASRSFTLLKTILELRITKNELKLVQIYLCYKNPGNKEQNLDWFEILYIQKILQYVNFTDFAVNADTYV